MKAWLPLLLISLAACSTAPKKSATPPASASHDGKPAAVQPAVTDSKCRNAYLPAQEDPSTRGNYTAGGLYAPGVSDSTPEHVPDLDCIREPQVTREQKSAVGNRSPYRVLGKEYVVRERPDGYVEQGTASYYGAKFHGRKTSNQEVYDMYAFTAAHKSLPLPSFARVTNLDNGQSVIVRVNDRGPFHEGRIIDLSYAAAIKLGITQRGTGRVEVRAVTPENSANDSRQLARARARAPASRAAPAAVPPATTAMDQWVGQLPPSSTPPPMVTVLVPASAANNAQRYQVHPNLQNPASAERFDAWMQANGVRVATGKPGKPVVAAASAVPVARQDEIAGSFEPARPTVSATPAVSSALQLQVASFASRENADRALQRLNAAGIGNASLSDAGSNGRSLWRLRVAASDASSAEALATRIAGLGFERPQLVRE